MQEASNLGLLSERLGNAYSNPEAFFEIIHPDVAWDIRFGDRAAALAAAGLSSGA